MLHTRSTSSRVQQQQQQYKHMMEDSGHCAAAVLSFTDALGLYAFDDALGPLTDAFDVTVDSVSECAWPELAEWTTPELVQVATVSDEKETKKPEATVVRHPQRRHTRVKRTRARPEPPTPKPRKRAKTEILILQSQVAELQAQLSQLQDAAREPTAEKITESPAATQSDSRSLASKAPEWSQLATIELQKLKEAQALNASLKAALAKESHVREAFQTELQEMNKIQAESFELLDEIASAISADCRQETELASSLTQIRRILVDLDQFYCDGADLAIDVTDEALPG